MPIIGIPALFIFAVALEGMIGQLIALRQELGTNAIANNFKDASDFATKLRR